MYPHHQRVLERIREKFANDPQFHAILLGGSIAHGWGRESSDVDVYMVVDDETFARLQEKNALFYYDTELCDYPGGYIDGKIITYSFMKEAADRGSEPTRSSFIGSYPIYNRVPGLEDVLRRIPVYPVEEKAEKISAFYAQVQLLGHYFVRQALEKGNRYLLAHAVSDLVLFGSRLILAHNERLYPGHKSLFRVLELAEDKPADFMELADRLLQAPTLDNAKAFIDCVEQFSSWGVPYPEAVSLFIEHNEWNWRQGRPPLEDW